MTSRVVALVMSRVVALVTSRVVALVTSRVALVTSRVALVMSRVALVTSRVVALVMSRCHKRPKCFLLSSSKIGFAKSQQIVLQSSKLAIKM